MAWASSPPDLSPPPASSPEEPAPPPVAVATSGILKWFLFLICPTFCCHGATLCYHNRMRNVTGDAVHEVCPRVHACVCFGLIVILGLWLIAAIISLLYEHKSRCTQRLKTRFETFFFCRKGFSSTEQGDDGFRTAVLRNQRRWIPETLPVRFIKELLHTKHPELTSAAVLELRTQSHTHSVISPALRLTSGGGKSCPNSTGFVRLVHAVVLCFYDTSSLFKGAVRHVEKRLVEMCINLV